MRAAAVRWCRSGFSVWIISGETDTARMPVSGADFGSASGSTHCPPVDALGSWLEIIVL